MHVTNDLIENFFMEKCTPAEAGKVVSYLHLNPEILDKYLSKVEWDQEITADHKSELFWDEIWNEIRPKGREKTHKLSFLRYAVAASLIAAMVAFTVNYFSKQVEQKAEQSAILFKHRMIRNTGKTIKEIKLTDGSKINLYADAKIEYDEPFQHNKRDIYLEGEADFKVAKDKTKPFTVFSSHISTTALGTVFKVTSIPNSEQIIVHLYEGKVLVKSSPMAQKKINKNFYLLPGDELIYNKLTAIADIIHRKNSKKTGQSHLLVFDKEPLSEVFDQLASKYNVHIQYSNDDFANMYYIGSFDRTDSIENILNNIIKLNGLTLKKNSDNDYIIQKEIKKP
jgi:transmembrane sensor